MRQTHRVSYEIRDIDVDPSDGSAVVSARIPRNAEHKAIGVLYRVTVEGDLSESRPDLFNSGAGLDVLESGGMVTLGGHDGGGWLQLRDADGEVLDEIRTWSLYAYARSDNEIVYCLGSVQTRLTIGAEG